MKIVNRAAFLALPDGTLFSKSEPDCFGPVGIKYGTYTWEDHDGKRIGDFRVVQPHDSIKHYSSDGFSEACDALVAGASVPLDFSEEGSFRDGLHDQAQLFAVWEQADIDALIARLKECRGA